MHCLVQILQNLGLTQIHFLKYNDFTCSSNPDNKTYPTYKKTESHRLWPIQSQTNRFEGKMHATQSKVYFGGQQYRRGNLQTCAMRMTQSAYYAKDALLYSLHTIRIVQCHLPLLDAGTRMGRCG